MLPSILGLVFRPKHAFEHDVESLFWVLVWICLKASRARDPAANAYFEQLECDELSRVCLAKEQILLACQNSKVGLPVVGKRFGGARAFLEKFGALCAIGQATFQNVNTLFEDYKSGKLTVSAVNAVNDDINTQQALPVRSSTPNKRLREQYEETSEVAAAPGRSQSRDSSGSKRVRTDAGSPSGSEA